MNYRPFGTLDFRASAHGSNGGRSQGARKERSAELGEGFRALVPEYTTP
jgi:hypothetical protein